jgi:tRNA-specific 2-thiouridylase
MEGNGLPISCVCGLSQVFSGFVQAYGNGGTPNPDLVCNRNIKFGELLAAARRLGAEAVATGVHV